MLSKLLALLMAFLSMGQSALNSYMDQLSLGGNLFLANRDYLIAADYVPDDLVTPNVRRGGSSVQMRKEAAAALEELFKAAKDEENYTLLAISGYRSYQTQASIFNRKVKNVGREKAMLLVALPGASEHQLGLAMDVGCKRSTGLTGSFGKTPEGKWLAENCYRFGFILRYKAEWTETTGYAYEPWHIRYVGTEHAARIKELDIPFEDYIAVLVQARDAALPDGKE